MTRSQRILIVVAMVAAAACGSSSQSVPADAGSISRAQFEMVFPHHNSFYTYDGFLASGGGSLSPRDTAAFLANVHHETGGLTIVSEAPSRRGIYCDDSKPYGCPAGRNDYFGRGPIQLSWNYNYKAAGDALGVDLLNDPSLIGRDPAVAWGTALWYWNTHVPGGADFGDTIRAINGPQECDGGNPAQVQSRVNAYLRITNLLGVSPGGGLSC